MNRIILTFLITCTLLILAFSQPASAQGQVTCDPAALIKKANELKSTGDVRSDLFELNQLMMQIQQMNAACIKASFNVTITPTESITATRTAKKPSATPRLGAKVKETPTPLPTAAKDEGKRSNPIPFGHVAHIDWTGAEGDQRKYEMAITQLVRGSDAWQRLRKANSVWNNPAPAELEWVLIFTEITYTNGSQDKPIKFTGENCRTVSNNEVMKEATIVVEPHPAFDLTLFPGGKGAGWLAKFAYPDDPNPLLVCGMSSDGSGGIYFALAT
jgi:hypothetical protein